MIIRYEKDVNAYKMAPFGPHIDGDDAEDAVGEDKYAVYKRSGECISKGHKSSADATTWLENQVKSKCVKANKNSVFYILWYRRLAMQRSDMLFKSLLNDLERSAERSAEKCGIELAGPVKAVISVDRRRKKK